HQRTWYRLQRLRGRGDARRLLSRRPDGDADQRGALVSHAARLLDVDAAQCAHAGRPARAWVRPRCRAVVRLLADRPRSPVERHCWRHGRIRDSSLARGVAMSVLSGEFGAYLALVLV